MYFEGDADDGPLPPPKHVAEAIPPFHLHGERQCGDHRHDTSGSILERYLERQGKQASAVWNLACSNCRARTTLNQLHDLPCGDLICRGCLQVKVLSIKLGIDANHERIWQARTTMEGIEHCFRQNLRMTQSQKRALIQGYGQLRRRVLRLAGFTCCGKNMKLYRFMSCLSPKPSRDLWIITQWVRDPPSNQRVCGWPDCGAYVPICCTYLLPGGEGLRWHCVICQGNSMDCERDLRSAQTRFPYLPSGQPALTPSR
ncbi:hypothetical protein C7999DRAFT_41979 [Corynascus novoguineensis]|uniref:Uncharacterized protein n=1 Tax=Corynascus novoguineensis TaxID=1126955 RepID=A0AAN7CSV2_9PEZI|nr:hypothetical protein C7999DRAFT_41979 [Corynascus novoguineensis]